jgi:hypothetical protein
VNPSAESEPLVSSGFTRQSEPTHELKFLLSAELAREVERWARAELAPDHASRAGAKDSPSHVACLVSTICFDTPELDVYHRSRGHRKHTFRTRRYDDAPWLWLEKRSRRRDRVSMRRVAIPDSELVHTASDPSDQKERESPWPGAWFRDELEARGLVPACRITSRRSEFFGRCILASSSPSFEEPIHLTLDRDVRGVAFHDRTTRSHAIPQPEPGSASDSASDRALTDLVVLKLKCRRELPERVKSLILDLRLSPSPFSKYRRCMDAWMTVATPAETADA